MERVFCAQTHSTEAPNIINDWRKIVVGKKKNQPEAKSQLPVSEPGYARRKPRQSAPGSVASVNGHILIPTNPLVFIDQSRIHGKGLFARKKIKKGKTIGRLVVRSSNEDGPHVLWIGDGEFGFEVLCELRYINHCATPNACYFDDLTVVALSDIKPGEEITHHYGDEWD